MSVKQEEMVDMCLPPKSIISIKSLCTTLSGQKTSTKIFCSTGVRQYWGVFKKIPKQISHTMGISATSVPRIITKHKYHPCHIQLHQELLGVDFPQREAFCKWALEMLNQDVDFFYKSDVLG
ncbi:hypothetical protein NQ318_011152 [Aromia moschata]|uniref:Uncharacterized protein n=1 Tax=Aromia moschata TaxID=1265417 RepID=A0AAV8YIP6_9CUCU|nr:hypothetical protein NQ318_011152 [Aromia moschata]